MCVQVSQYFERSVRRHELVEAAPGLRCLVEFGEYEELADTLDVILAAGAGGARWRFVPETEGGTS